MPKALVVVVWGLETSYGDYGDQNERAPNTGGLVFKALRAGQHPGVSPSTSNK
jgi:hypothetical protein